MKLLVLFGGMSSEHDVSCVSAASILRNLDKQKYDIIAVGITKDGVWKLLQQIDPDKIQNGTWEDYDTVSAMLVPDRSVHGLIVLGEQGAQTIRVDCCFPVLHGAYGEDGTMQGLLELAGIPYVGCGVAASANGMDKSLTKLVVDAAGVRQAEYALLFREDFEQNPDGVMQRTMAHLKQFPVFVKPCSSGSSVGVHKATDMDSLQAGLQEAFQWDKKVLVEEFIKGREVEVAVLGNRTPKASIAGEIAPTQEFYTYDAKYQDESSALYIPARISDAAMEQLRQNALRVYTAMGCRGLSRVDFFCTETEELVFNEINTIPGFTSISMYPKLFAHGSIAYPDLLDALIAYALEEHHG